MKPSFRALTGITILLVLIAVGVTRAQAPAPPTGLVAQVAGTLVTLSWNAAAGAGSYIVQVGSAPGASNVFQGNVGNTTTVSGNAPAGTYFARVIAVSFGGVMSGPSAEVQFGVGGCVPPGPPQGFTATVSGVRVTLQWSPGSGSPPTTYIVEAGSSPGLANLFNSPTGNTLSLSVDAPPGTYFVRLRAQNDCGTSGVSAEQTVVVGDNGGSCTYAIAPDSVNVPFAGGQVQVNVTAPGGCRWQLDSDPFIFPMSNPTGAGSATVGYSVMGTASPREGQILLRALDPGTVTASRVAVRQGGTPCAVTLNPTSQTVPAASGVYEFRVNSAAGCTWTVTPLAPFLSIVSAGTGMGSDGVRYLVAVNAATAARSGVIRVMSAAGSQDFSVTQQGNPPPVARFVMMQANAATRVCQVSQRPPPPSPLGPCSLDGSTSTPAAEITSYEWRTVRFRVGAEDLVDTYTGVNPTLVLPCTVNGGDQETFEVRLTVRNALGQSNTVTDMLSLLRPGCGQ